MMQERETVTDAITLIREKRFLGQEFLTWLWFKSEERGGAVELSSGEDVLVRFERFMVLEEGEGDSSESLTLKGLRTGLVEALAGLAQGKKVARARLRLGRGDHEWALTMDGATFDISSLKTPKSLRPGEEEAGDLSFEGRVLEKAFLLEHAVETVDFLFKAFLEIRLPRDAWDNERRLLKGWIAKASLP